MPHRKDYTTNNIQERIRIKKEAKVALNIDIPLTLPEHCSLTRADLQQVLEFTKDFRTCIFHSVDFTNMNLEGANFEQSTFKDCVFRQTNLRNTVFSRATMTNSEFVA